MSSFRLRTLGASLLAAVVIAVTALAAGTLALFLANGQQLEILGPAVAYYAIPALIVFVVLAILGLVGVYSRWYTALIGGVAAAVLAVLVSAGLPLIGAQFTSDVLAQYASRQIALELVFALAVVVATVTLGRRIHGALAITETEEVLRRQYALVRRPAASLDEGVVTHIERTPVDVELAGRQWEAYVAALTGAGWEPVEVQPDDDLPDSVFVEDTVVMFGPLAVLTNPGTDSRTAEVDAVEDTVLGLSLETARIEAPGTLDGGDVLKIGRTVFVGRGGRTNADGIRQLRKILAPRGYSVVAVPMTKALHLKSAVTALPDGTVIGYRPVVDDPFVFDRFLEMPEEGGAHVVILSDDTVLMASSAPESARIIEGLGYRVISVDISEFEKLEGCVTCLSVRIR
ncbi:dimethylargininase [Cnuibacter sp. UC19_7]|uniref:dimethylargininase n=1 Tax=Cnuibacter sp. UC19_7 TaxID=3350166 RepID=UPI00366F92C3